MSNDENHGIFPLGGTENLQRSLDVVFIHGLGGDAYTSWTVGNQEKSFWPNWLAEDFEQIGVWTIGYGASPSRWVEDVMPLEHRALNIINHLSLKQIGTRPLLLITHSMGGLLAKHIITQASHSGNITYQALGNNIKGLIFIAVPHNGDGWANFLDAARLIVRGNKLIESLRKDNASLLTLSNAFNALVGKNNITCRSFFETKEIRPKGWKNILRKGIKVVSEASARGDFPQDAPIGLDADHLSICKLSSRDTQLYGNVIWLIEELLGTPSGTRGVSAKPDISHQADIQRGRQETINRFLNSLMWCFLTMFFGLLQVWFVLAIHHSILVNVLVPAKTLFMDGALLFFSTAVVSSLAVDYSYFSKKLTKNTLLERIMFVVFPGFIITVSILLFVTCYILDIAKSHIIIDQSSVGSIELAIITCTLIYAFCIKLITFKFE